MDTRGDRLWVFVLRDQDGVFTARGRSRSDVNIISLPRPTVSGATCTGKYMLCGSRLLELQKVTPKTPTSWFIDDNVRKDGSLFMATEVDPLFFFLPVLQGKDKFMQLSQLLSSGGGHLRHLTACAGAQLSCICDVNDRFGPDNICYRVNSARVVAWLAVKAKRLSRVFARRHAKLAREAAASSAFNTTSSALDGASADSGGKTPDGDVELDPKSLRLGLIDAVHVLREYVSASWIKALCPAVGVTQEALADAEAARGKKAGQNMPDSAAAAWNSAGANDVSRFQKRTGGDMDSPRARKKARTTSRAQKALAKVNKKGMKSISSFFSKAPKSKRKTKKK